MGDGKLIIDITCVKRDNLKTRRCNITRNWCHFKITIRCPLRHEKILMKGFLKYYLGSFLNEKTLVPHLHHGYEHLNNEIVTNQLQIDKHSYIIN